MAEGKIIIRGEDRISKPLKDIRQSIDNLNSSNLTKLAFSFNQVTSAVNVAIGAFNKVYSIASNMTTEFGESEKISIKLQAVWKNLGETLSYSVRDVQDYADELERLTYFSGEDILEAQKLLAATEKLTDEGFERAREASADLASAMGTTMASAAQTLSKALMEPESGLTALRKIGIAFSDDEKEQIKVLIESNKTYEAQSKILQKVEDRYKGVAKAMHETETGTIDSINTSLANIRKNLGSELLDVISPALKELYGWLYKIEHWAAEKITTNKIFRSISRDGEMSFNLASDYTSSQLKRALAEAQSNMTEASGRMDSYYKLVYGGENYQAGNWKPLLQANGITPDEESYNRYYEMAQAVETISNALRQQELDAEFASEGFKRWSGTVVDDAIEASDSVIESLESTGSVVEEVAEKAKTAADFINENKSMSKEAMRTYYQAQIEQAKLFKEQEGITNSQIGQIDEIISAYDKLIAKLDETAEATNESGKTFEDYFHNITGAINNVLGRVTDFYKTMYESQAENLQNQLDAEKEAGSISIEEEQKKQAEINKLKEKAFESEKANSIAQATISGIEAAINAYKALAGINPALGAMAAATVSAYTAAQVAQISSQKYTAMATGGVVTDGPVHALVGEAGPEAVIPLNNAKSRALLEGNDGGGTIVFNITIEGNADEEKIFSAIERAQRTGVLPRWKYAI